MIKPFLKLNYKRSNQMGFTLLEVMVASGMLAVASLVFVGGIAQINKVYGTTKVNETVDNQIQQIIESIRPNAGLYKMNFKDDSNPLDSTANLPMAWGPGVVATAEQCPDCPGRFGYVIKPYDATLRGLYIVTIRFTLKEWENTPENGKRDYQFLVTPK